MYPKIELDQMIAGKKQLAKIQEVEQLTVVIIMKEICRNRREYILKARIPFVVPNVQM